LAAVFGRPSWDVSFYINTDAATLLGTDTFENGAVSLRKGPIYRCAEDGGFGILDEINMAKNESLAVLHATLDFRRSIDMPGYDRIPLHEATRFIATMNYGYAGTRELNEALASRFVVIDMPAITSEGLVKLLTREFPNLKPAYADQFAGLFQDIQRKCDGGELSTKPLDLRGLLAAARLIKTGLEGNRALALGLVNKSFDDFEKQLVTDVIRTRLPEHFTAEDVFD
jgi:MoxR-like ATPase